MQRMRSVETVRLLLSNFCSRSDSVFDLIANGVLDWCDFIKVHAANGILLNWLLFGADIQRKVAPENIWNAQAVKKIGCEEITEAMELLWRIAGDSVIGKMVKRQGANKSLMECNVMHLNLCQKKRAYQCFSVLVQYSNTVIYWSVLETYWHFEKVPGSPISNFSEIY